MAHFARLDGNNTVTMVTVVSNADMIDERGHEVEAIGVAVCESVVGPGPWVQTSFNGNFRRRYAGIGFAYDAERDVFIAPKPHPSWVLNDQDDWEAPTPMPDDGKAYQWDEETLSWDEIESD
jgi:hypothetical protein